MDDCNSDLLVCFEFLKFIQTTAYLSDIFHRLDELNLSLHGKGMNMAKASEKLKFFIDKLPLWCHRLQDGNLENFPFVDEIVVECDASLQRNVQLDIVEQMEFLSASFDNYFSPGEFNVMGSRTIDPFTFNAIKLPDDKSCKEDFISLKEIRIVKMEFESMFLKRRTGNIFKVGRKSTSSSISFLGNLSVRNRVFFPGLLKN